MKETSRKSGASAAKGKVIITCAVTGAIHTPTMSPYLPITPDQIASEAIANGGHYATLNEFSTKHF